MKVQSILNGDSFEVVPSTVRSGTLPDYEPVRYSVMIATKARPGDVEIGYVTTHLSLEDWCEMHGRILIKHYPNKATAPKPNEKPIDLF